MGGSIDLNQQSLDLNRQITDLQDKNPNDPKIEQLKKKKHKIDAEISTGLGGQPDASRPGLEVQKGTKQPKAEPYSPEENQKAAKQAGEVCPKAPSGLPNKDCVAETGLAILQRNRKEAETKKEEPSEFVKDFNESYDSCNAENPDNSGKMLDCLSERTLIKHLTRHPEDAGTLSGELGILKHQDDRFQGFIDKNDKKKLDKGALHEGLRSVEEGEAANAKAADPQYELGTPTELGKAYKKAEAKAEAKETCKLLPNPKQNANCINQLTTYLLNENREAAEVEVHSEHQTGSAVDSDKPTQNAAGMEYQKNLWKKEGKIIWGEPSEHQTGSAIDSDKPPLSPAEKKKLENLWLEKPATTWGEETPSPATPKTKEPTIEERTLNKSRINSKKDLLKQPDRLEIEPESKIPKKPEYEKVRRSIIHPPFNSD